MVFERWILASCSPGLCDSPSGWKMGNGVFGSAYFSDQSSLFGRSLDFVERGWSNINAKSLELSLNEIHITRVNKVGPVDVI